MYQQHIMTAQLGVCQSAFPTFKCVNVIQYYKQDAALTEVGSLPVTVIRYERGMIFYISLQYQFGMVFGS